MAIRPEDGTGVEGANSLVHPAFAAEYHADRGNLSESGEDSVTGATFDPVAGTIDAPGTTVPVNSIISIEGGTLLPGNSGFAYVNSVTGTLLGVSWLDEMQVQAGVDLTLVRWNQLGWWSTKRRLEASLINATEYLSSRSWLGYPVNEVQGTPFPREGLFVSSTGQYYQRGYEIPSNVVPDPVKHAVCHLALEDLTEPLAEVRRPSQQLKSKRIGPISKTFENPRGWRKFPTVERMLIGLVASRTPFRPIIPT